MKHILDVTTVVYQFWKLARSSHFSTQTTRNVVSFLIVVFWVMRPCSLASAYQLSVGTLCLLF
jgi:hypothetical protein